MSVHCLCDLDLYEPPIHYKWCPWPVLITTWQTGVWRTGEEDLPKIFVSPGNKRQCVTFRGHTPRLCQCVWDTIAHRDTAGTAGTLPARLEHCQHGWNTARTLPVCLGHKRTPGTLPARPEHCRHGRNTTGTTGTLPARPEHSQDSVIVSGTRSRWENRRTARMSLCW